MQTRQIQFLALGLLSATTLVITPNISIDPINLPKYFVLTLGSLLILAYLISSTSEVVKSLNKSFILTSLSFFVALCSSLLFSGSPLVEQVFGTFGRNTGFVSLFALAILSLAMAAVAERNFARRAVFALISLSTFNGLYGLVQFMNLDPVNWSNPYNPIVGTLGNPNFVSSFLAIASIALMAMIGVNQASKSRDFLYVTLLLINGFVVYKTDSIQGLVILCVGVIFVLYMRFIYFRCSDKLNTTVSMSAVSLGGFIFAGFFNQGPLSRFLLQETGIFRIDYWKAGINMTLSHPIFGVGLDSYGDWYRAERSLEATLRRGPEMVSNSAHSVFLDISSNGGFPLLISYCAIVTLAIRASFQLIRRMEKFEPIFISLIGIYGCYLLQSLISVNQLGLAVWGWAVGGLLIGLNAREKSDLLTKDLKVRKVGKKENPSLAAINVIMGFAIGLLLAIPPMHKDNAYRRALEISSGEKIEQLTNSFPKLEHYFTASMITFSENGYEDEALVVAKLTTKDFPRNFKAWEFIYKTSLSTAEEKESAKKMLLELDPYNPSLRS